MGGRRKRITAESKGGTRLVTESLVDRTGAIHEAQAVTKIADQIGRATRIAKVAATLDLPNVGDEFRVPVKLLAGSDDLPEDVEYVSVLDELVVQRV